MPVLTQSDVVRPFKVARWGLGEARLLRLRLAMTFLALHVCRRNLALSPLRGEGDQKSKIKDQKPKIGHLEF